MFRVYKRMPMEVNPDPTDSIVKPTCKLCNYLHHEVEGQAGDSFDGADGHACLQGIQRPRGNQASTKALHN